MWVLLLRCLRTHRRQFYLFLTFISSHDIGFLTSATVHYFHPHTKLTRIW